MLSLALLVLSIVGGGWDDLGQLAFRGVLLALAVLLGVLIWASVVDPNRPEAVASGSGVRPACHHREHASLRSPWLSTSPAAGAVMYSAYWCPHCHEQKELFGKEASDQTLKVVECAPDGQNNQVDLCRSKGIGGFPQLGDQRQH